MGNNLDLGALLRTGFSALGNGNNNANAINQVLPSLVNLGSNLLGGTRGTTGTGNTSTGSNPLNALNPLNLLGGAAGSGATNATSVIGNGAGLLAGSVLNGALTGLGVPPGSLGMAVGAGARLLNAGATVAEAGTPLVTGLMGRMGRMLG